MEIGSIHSLNACDNTTATAGPGMASLRPYTPSVEDRLLERKKRLEADLADTNAAITALQANPEILKVLCLISKVNY